MFQLRISAEVQRCSMDIVISEVCDKFEEWAVVIRNSFATVAEEFGLHGKCPDKSCVCRS